MVSNKLSSEKNITEKSISGFIWTFVGTGGQAIFQIVTLAILARLLTPAEFGVAGSAVVITQFSNIFSELGVGPAIVQRQELSEIHIKVGFTISLVFGIIVATVIYFSTAYAALFFNTPELEDALKVYAISFILKGVSVISESLLQRELKFKTLTTIELISYIFGYAAVGIALAYYDFGYWALVGAHTSQSFIKSLGVMILAPIKPKIGFDRDAFKALLHFGTGLTLGRIANYLANQGDNLVIGRTLGPDALGGYGRAYQLVVMPANMFGQVFDKVMFPAIAKSQNDKTKVGVYYSNTTSLIIWILVPFSVFVWILTPDIILVLLGDQWLSLNWPFRILSMGITFRVLHKISDTLTRSLGAVYHRALIQLLYALFVIFGAWIGHFDGITGVSACVLVAIFINYLAMSILCVLLTNIKMVSYLRVIVPGTMLGAASYFILNAYVAQISTYYSSLVKILLCFVLLLLLYIIPIKLNIYLLTGLQNPKIIKNIVSQLRKRSIKNDDTFAKKNQ